MGPNRATAHVSPPHHPSDVAFFLRAWSRHAGPAAATAWTSPWTVQFPLRRLNSMVGEIDEVSVPQMFEYACHERNYGLLNILAGARKLEMNAAQASKQ